MSKVHVSYTHDDAVARIVLDDGKGNILDRAMVEELQNAFKEFAKMTWLKLITFEGAGKHFSFGASVEEHQKAHAKDMLTQFHQLFYMLSYLSIPTLAKVRGQCLGGGMELVLMCDFVFADATAKFGQPEIVLGVFAPPASILLAEKIGLSRAEELLITGRSISAEEAKQAGFVNAVYADEAELERETSHWIEKMILPKSASSLRYAVKAARIKFNRVLTEFLPRLEQLYLDGLMETYDANEGIQAFLEKRSPAWESSKTLSS